MKKNDNRVLGVGDQLIAFLHTGHILLHHPDKSRFNSIAKILIKWGTDVDLKKAEEAYFNTRVLPRRQYEALIQLLSIFAQHLAACGNQLALQRGRAEPAAVARARGASGDKEIAKMVSLTRKIAIINLAA